MDDARCCRPDLLDANPANENSQRGLSHRPSNIRPSTKPASETLVAQKLLPLYQLESCSSFFQSTLKFSPSHLIDHEGAAFDAVGNA